MWAVHVAESHVNDRVDEPGTGVADGRGAARRVMAFLIERFPPAPQLVLMAVLFVAATTMPELLLVPDVVERVGDIEVGAALCAFFAALLFVVRLRVFDDVKDADVDRVESPDRPIPRGLVSVRELDVTAVLILAIEGVLMANVGVTSLWLWVIAAVWSILMRVEFFAPEWLDRHPATFAITHMAVLGMLFGMMLAVGVEARSGAVSLSELLGSWLAMGAVLAATSIGIGFEWGRKFERYHAVHGERAWTLWLLWPSVGALLFTVLVRDSYPIGAVVALVVVTMLTIVTHALVMGQRAHPEARGGIGDAPTGGVRDLVEQVPGGTGLLVYLILAIAGIVELVR